MSNETVTTTVVPQDPNPFRGRDLSPHVNAGAVAIESDRAIAEAQGKLVIAKRFPRDEARAYSAMMAACSRKALADAAIYAYPRAGQTISGPSIRLAEELARCWGNMSYGTRELSRKEGVSEMEAFAWDEETNVRSVQQFTVRHIRDTRSGGVKLTEERDIYELTANQAGRRLRARILAIIPHDIQQAAVDQCRKTVAGATDEPLSDRARKMVAAFAKFGATAEQIEAKIGHPIAQITPDDIADLTAIYTSLRDGQSKVGDWFQTFSAADMAGVDPTRPVRLQQVVGARTDTQPPADEPPADVIEGEQPEGVF